MQENLILSECQEITALLQKPINTTQRIKYTCLNVSTNLIVLGSTSGSLYLFTRDACAFQQLIPLSEGAVTQMSISPDEKVVALSTNRGSVCLVLLKPTVRQTAVSVEHSGDRVTSLCWNENSTELYIGDGSGRISVMTLTIFTVNGMFQAPASSLMHLDSSIVQMDFCSSLLLISTLTRCYICDTSKEQYKQIGNKMRDGEFGACFYQTHMERDKDASSLQQEQTVLKRTGSFDLINEGESEMTEEHYPRIYCARPGSRLWEVTANGTVVKTHQMKEALAIPPCFVYRLQEPKPSANTHAEQTWPPQSLNFSRLRVISSKYLFTYTSNGLYIINPVDAAVTLWTNEYTNIAVANVVEDKIYLMTKTGLFHCLMFSSTDTLILKLFEKKQYSECLRAFAVLKSQILKSLPDENVPEICDIETKLKLSESNEISIHLLPLITLIKSNQNTLPIKLDSGIVVVNPRNYKPRIETNKGNIFETKDKNAKSGSSRFTLNEESTKLEDLTSGIADIKIEDNTDILLNIECDADLILNTDSMEAEEEQTDADEVASPEANEPNASSQLELNIAQDAIDDLQTNLQIVYSLANTITSSMPENELEAIILKMHEKMNESRESCEKLPEPTPNSLKAVQTAEQYYKNILLSNLIVVQLTTTQGENILHEALKSFIDLNSSDYKECVCGFPCPHEKLSEPRFLEIGQAILQRLSKAKSEEPCIDLCRRVPYMWRHYLPFYIKQGCSINDTILAQCLQTRDAVILAILLPRLETNQWETVDSHLKKITRNLCLLCRKPIENRSSNDSLAINWNNVANRIMKREGSNVAMKCLLKIQSISIDISLSKSLFQSLIFTKILECRGLRHCVDFNKDFVDKDEYGPLGCTKVQSQLLQSLEKDLNRPVDRRVFGTKAHHWGIRHKPAASICPCCTLSLQTPILLDNNGISLFPCGHAYHANCLIQKKILRCNLHS